MSRQRRNGVSPEQQPPLRQSGGSMSADASDGSKSPNKGNVNFAPHLAPNHHGPPSRPVAIANPHSSMSKLGQSMPNLHHNGSHAMNPASYHAQNNYSYNHGHNYNFGYGSNSGTPRAPQTPITPNTPSTSHPPIRGSHNRGAGGASGGGSIISQISDVSSVLGASRDNHYQFDPDNLEMDRESQDDSNNSEWSSSDFEDSEEPENETTTTTTLLNDSGGGHNGHSHHHGNRNSSNYGHSQSAKMQAIVRPKSSRSSRNNGRHGFGGGSRDSKHNNHSSKRESSRNSSKGRWIQCRETESGRYLYYNAKTLEIVFDKPPKNSNYSSNNAIARRSKSGTVTEYEFLQKLNESLDSTDMIEENDIPTFVLKFDNHSWNFNNDYCDVYRCQANRVNHKDMLPNPEDVVFPEFFSNHVIPKQPSFVAKILPPNDFPTVTKHWTTKIEIAKTTAKDIITKFVDKLKLHSTPKTTPKAAATPAPDRPLSGKQTFYLPSAASGAVSMTRNSKKWDFKIDDSGAIKANTTTFNDTEVPTADQFVLKVVGCEEYILYDHTKLIIDYEAVRRAVRNEDDVTFALVHRPDIDDLVEEAYRVEEEYKKEFDFKYSRYSLNIKSPNFLLYEKYGCGAGMSILEKHLESIERSKMRAQQNASRKAKITSQKDKDKINNNNSNNNNKNEQPQTPSLSHSIGLLPDDEVFGVEVSSDIDNDSLELSDFEESPSVSPREIQFAPISLSPHNSNKQQNTTVVSLMNQSVKAVHNHANHATQHSNSHNSTHSNHSNNSTKGSKPKHARKFAKSRASANGSDKLAVIPKKPLPALPKKSVSVDAHGTSRNVSKSTGGNNSKHSKNNSNGAGNGSNGSNANGSLKLQKSVSAHTFVDSHVAASVNSENEESKFGGDKRNSSKIHQSPAVTFRSFRHSSRLNPHRSSVTLYAGITNNNTKNPHKRHSAKKKHAHKLASHADGNSSGKVGSPYGSEPSLKDSSWLRKQIPSISSAMDRAPRSMLLDEFNHPYKMRVNGLSNVMYLPRFIKGKTLAVVVRCELWMGSLKYNNAAFDTPNIRTITNEMVFTDWFQCLQLKFCDLPREATISFTVVGMSRNEDKNAKADNRVVETPLAYCRFPLIDHRHCLRNGQYRLNLWPIPKFKKTKHGVKSDPYGGKWEFRYRGPTRDCYIISDKQRQKRARRQKRLKKQTGVTDKGSGGSRGGSGGKRKKKSTIATVVSNSTNNSDRTSSKRNSTKKKHSKKKRGICQLFFEFEQRTFDVVAPMIAVGKMTPSKKNQKNKDKDSASLNGIQPANKILNDKEWKQVHHIITRDVLTELSDDEKEVIWKGRDQLVHMPDALPTFLRSVDWRDPKHRGEAYQYLRQWQPPLYLEDALELLTFEFADTRVREYGVMCIANMHDSDLQRYLLQLVQCLKFELHHNNALIRLLMRRALMNRYQIGHFLFWHLMSEFTGSEIGCVVYNNILHDRNYYTKQNKQDAKGHDGGEHEETDESSFFGSFEWCERFGLYIEEYLLFSTTHARELLMQCNLMNRLQMISQKIYYFKKFEHMESSLLKSKLALYLTEFNKSLPNTISMPLNPRWRCTHCIVNKCRYMSSAQVPLWLEFANADTNADNIKILFKAGDDLRQDILTLQVLRIMDKLWLDRGLNLRLLPYNVVSTGNSLGMVEIVLNSDTTNNIHCDFGGGPQKGATNVTTHFQFLNKYNPTLHEFEKARDNYLRSVAGYCIATYVLGIGDRHPDNIMIRKTGELFHIDFGHFLGNFKTKKLGLVTVNREKAPFVFLPAMKYVIEYNYKSQTSDNKHLYSKFVEYCLGAYMALRIRHRLLFNLFLLMVPSVMPELVQTGDIHYMRDQLHLYDVKQDQVESHIIKTLKKCLNDKTRIMDNMFHAMKHAK